MKTLFVALTALLMLASCKKEETEKNIPELLVGKWKVEHLFEDGEDQIGETENFVTTMEIEFHDGGIFSLKEFRKSKATGLTSADKSSASYSVDNEGNITILGDDAPIEGKVLRVDEKQLEIDLIVDENDGDASLVNIEASRIE